MSLKKEMFYPLDTLIVTFLYLIMLVLSLVTVVGIMDVPYDMKIGRVFFFPLR